MKHYDTITNEVAISSLDQIRHILLRSESWDESTHNPINQAFDMAIRALWRTSKNGKWLWKLADNGWADHICSECGYTENTDIHVSLGYRYCPNCGAYMR